MPDARLKDPESARFNIEKSAEVKHGVIEDHENERGAFKEIELPDALRIL